MRKLHKCKPAILIWQATSIVFHHCLRCRLGRPESYFTRCAAFSREQTISARNVVRISSHRNGPSIFRNIVFGMCGPAKAADTSSRIRSTYPDPDDGRFRPQQGGSDEQPIIGHPHRDCDRNRQHSDAHEQGMQKRLPRVVRSDVRPGTTSR